MIIHRNKGRIVFPSIKPILEYMFAKSFVDEKAIAAYVTKMERATAEANAGVKKVMSGPDMKRKKAWDFYTAEYVGPPKEIKEQAVVVYKMPLSKVGAQAILKWLKEDKGNACPNDIWIDDVQPIYDSIYAAANKKKG